MLDAHLVEMPCPVVEIRGFGDVYSEVIHTRSTALRQHRRRQLEERLAANMAWADTGAVFVRPDGQELHPTNDATSVFTAHVKAAGLPRIRLHDLRHTYATIALSNGVPITVVSRRLGHASVSITLDIYSHCMPTDDAAAAAKVAGLILGG